MSYTLISETVLSSSAASVTFSSIPQTYTDLVFEFLANTTATVGTLLQFNGDTGTNYSSTQLYGSGTSATSARTTNATSIAGSVIGAYPAPGLWNLLSYANTSVYKTVLVRGGNQDYVSGYVGLWRSTAAITSLLVSPGGGNSWQSGSVFRLWGVK